MNMKKMGQFRKERDTALLSLDRIQILTYYKKWGNNDVYQWFLKAEDVVFWGSVHKARTAITSLPPSAREESFRWLAEHGMKPYPGAEE